MENFSVFVNGVWRCFVVLVFMLLVVFCEILEVSLVGVVDVFY